MPMQQFVENEEEDHIEHDLDTYKQIAIDEKNKQIQLQNDI